ncbi:MAG: mechanosensitive ion channel family protein [Thermoleophilaceae bacterium]
MSAQIALASVLDRAGEGLGGFLPRLGGALLLLVVGIVGARLVGRFLKATLGRIGLDTAAERWNVSEVLGRAGLGDSLSALVARAVRVALSLVIVFAALSLLGLQFLSESLNQAVLFLPKALAAMGLLLAGVVLGGLVRRHVDRLSRQMDSPVPLGQVAQGAVVAVFAITAAAQIALSTAILMALVGILLAGVVATLALAFGNGGRALAAQMSAGRYVGGAFELGQHITVGDASGEVVALETAATVLRAADGSTLRVPNSLLLESVVTVQPGHE